MLVDVKFAYAAAAALASLCSPAFALRTHHGKCNLQFQQCIVDEKAGTGKKPSYIKVFCDSIAPCRVDQNACTWPEWQDFAVCSDYKRK